MFPADQLCETVTVYPGAGMGAYGPLFGEAYTIQVYLEPGVEVILSKTGKQVVANLFGVADGNCVIQADDEIEWNDQRYQVLAVEIYRFAGQTDHVELHFKSVESP
jgi:hypothetical protein